ncbi:LodA/GoxA family CTQ-dependent oxidase [Pseudomonas sp. 21LCFQ010]|uniref:LodA/GoxA family CTQ-dependent oxidase n=1 Tax=Pseudomonas sp. 21LCFQ010 TaxID=2957506 RepID=UPI002097B482|nr:LodA/GoxA family CTQ-dependent oxidase [Pseudomonas sp. 21LCFQ010]MCO8163468.1 LodA/GoxA family CTQ-dependent oxidase [Pseudomonas sp. 21LCFQ010]
MSSTYEIFPKIGVARLGNSPTEFYLSPQATGGLPLECDAQGNLQLDNGKPRFVNAFKDSVGRIKRQAAKFQIVRTDGTSPQPVTLDSEEISSIEWTVHIANKKPIWYTFSELQGNLEFGPDNSYEAQHIPVNNSNVTDPVARQQLIIDPGPRSISGAGQNIQFSRYNIPSDYSKGSFPPVGSGGEQIDVLGELKTDSSGNLVALGGFGKVTGSGEISSFRGASGYWDDISDGFVCAQITLRDGSKITPEPAWLIVGSPKYVPEVVNVITLADTLYDVAVRQMGADPSLFDSEQHTAQNSADYFAEIGKYCPLYGFNPTFKINFDAHIQPILDALSRYKWVANVPTMDEFARPSFDMRDSSDANRELRMAYFKYFRVPLLPADYDSHYADMEFGPAQLERDGQPMMPLNSGDNSVTNFGPIYKFLTLSATQYFFLYQWAKGNFTTARSSGSTSHRSVQKYYHQLHHAVAEAPQTQLALADISNCVGGPFSPGIEVTWSMRSANLYDAPFHIMLAHASSGQTDMQAHYREYGLSIQSRNETAPDADGKKIGCEPGDLTKRMAIPWMADFQECTVQTPNISDININQLSDGSGIELPPTYYVYWWPPQSPFNVMTGATHPQDQVLDAYVSQIDGQPVIPAGQNVEYQRGIFSKEDMISNWSALGFVVNQGSNEIPYLVEKERNFGQLAQFKMNNDYAIRLKAQGK